MVGESFVIEKLRIIFVVQIEITLGNFMFFFHFAL